MKSILQHLEEKLENLEAAPEKTPEDLEYMKKMKNVVKWLQAYLYHLEGGLCPANVSCLPAIVCTFLSSSNTYLALASGSDLWLASKATRLQKHNPPSSESQSPTPRQ